MVGEFGVVGGVVGGGRGVREGVVYPQDHEGGNRPVQAHRVRIIGGFFWL